MTKVTIDQSPIIVHKEGEEGALTIDRLTGRITTPHDERPDWAEGFAVALLAERRAFYEKRLGASSPVLEPAAIETSDLSWVGVNEAGDEMEIEADEDTRMSMLADALGVNMETGEMSGRVIAEREVERMTHEVSQEEVAAMHESVKAGFGAVDAEAMAAKEVNSK